MRVFTFVVLCLLYAGMAYCEEPEPVFEDRSLLDLLVAEKMIGYRHDSDSGTFIIGLLSDATKRRVRENYDDGGGFAERYARLRRELDDLRKGIRSNFLEGRGESDDRNQLAKQMIEKQRELAELQQPNELSVGAASVVAASVTRYGSDYIIIRELHSMREVLMPLERIAMVIDDRSIAEQPHATEPASQPVSSGDGSPPVR